MDNSEIDEDSSPMELSSEENQERNGKEVKITEESQEEITDIEGNFSEVEDSVVNHRLDSEAEDSTEEEDQRRKNSRNKVSKVEVKDENQVEDSSSERSEEIDFNLDNLVPNEKLESLGKLFAGYRFKFEGITSEEAENFLKNLIEYLGAKVTPSAKYTLTDLDYYLKDGNFDRRDLIGLGFVHQSIEKEQLVDIETYRFSNFKDQLAHKRIKVNKQNENVKKKQSSIKSEVHTNKAGLSKKTKNIKKDSSEEIEDFTNKAGSSKRTRNIKTSSEESEDYSNNNALNKRNEYEECSSASSSEHNNLQQPASGWIDAKKSSIKLDNVQVESSEDEIDFDSDDDSKWWEKKTNIPAHKLCRNNPCTYIPYPHTIHLNHSGKHQMTVFEKKTILMYLIQNNCLEEGKKRKTFKEMKEKGFMTHRSEESLRNCFRRGILQNLDSFNLPHHIKEELKEMRVATKKK